MIKNKSIWGMEQIIFPSEGGPIHYSSWRNTSFGIPTESEFKFLFHSQLPVSLG